MSASRISQLTVLQPGVLASVQDLGRFGHRAGGICPAGALDPLALRVANRLAGNADEAAGIEITMGGCQIRFDAATRIALAGDDFDARLDGLPLLPHWSMPVAAGQTLQLAGTNRWSDKAGVRSWLAVAGGIDVPLLLGSRSTDLKAGFGGHLGRALRKNDRLPLGDHTLTAEALARPAFGVKGPRWWGFGGDCEPEDTATLTWVRALPGPEFEQFDVGSQDRFWSQPWRITAQSNRQGARLSGPALARGDPVDLLSGAVLPGVVQVPPSGQPIVLLGDAQTVGGYPRIAVVIEADLWKLAQAPLKSELRFTPCDSATAHAARRLQQRYLDWVAGALVGIGWPGE